MGRCSRAPDLFGARTADHFLGLVALSRGGWRESDFRVLLPRLGGESWDELQFASLRRLFRGQMRQHGTLAQWDFNHAQMHAAARNLLASRGVDETALHAAIVDHLLSCRPDDPLRASETMVHLIGGEDWARSAHYYGDATLTAVELKGATDVMAGLVITAPRGEQAAVVQRLSRVIEAPRVTASIRALVAERFLFQLTDAVAYQAAVDARLAIADTARTAFEALVASDPSNARWQHDLAVSHANVGDAQVARGKLATALARYRDNLAMVKRLVQSDSDNAVLQHELAVALSRVGNAQMAQGDSAGALASHRDSLARCPSAWRKTIPQT